MSARAMSVVGSIVVAAFLAAVTFNVVTSRSVAQAAEPQIHSVLTFGATPDDRTDDTAALQRAFDALAPGDVLTFPQGTFRHNAVLTVRVAGVSLSGPAALVATNELKSALRIDADDVTLSGLTLGVSATTRRSTGPAQQKLWLSGHRGIVVRDVSVTGSAAAGVFVENATEFRLERVRVSDTRADGIHITKGSSYGVVDHPVVARTGDDGVAVVSYESDGPSCHNITVISPQVLGTTWGRGISVVGGSGITYTDVLVQDTDAAGVYIAVEGDPFFTGPVQDVMVRGGQVLRANRNTTIDHGAIVVFAGTKGVPMRGVDVTDLTVVDTRPSASHQVGVIAAPGGGAPVDLRFDRVRFDGGPATTYGGNVPTSRYRVTP